MIDFITNYYGIATVIIVFVHARMIHTDNPGWLQCFITFFSNFHMPAFFFIAGVLLRYTAKRHRSIFEWWRKKCLRLLVPYFALTILAYFPKYMLRLITGETDIEFSPVYLFRTFLRPQENIWGHFWFIPVYLTMMPIAFAIYRYVKSKIAIIFLIFILLFFNIYPIPTYWLGLSDISYQGIYLALGIVLSDDVIHMKEREIESSNVFIMCVLDIMLLIGVNCFKNLLLCRVTTAAGIYTYLLVGKLLTQECNKSIHLLGENNLLIYIYSWPFQAITEIVLLLILKLPVVVIFVVKLFLGIAGPITLRRIYQKLPHNNFFDLLFAI